MKTLFADIYNKIRELFQIEKSENTSECATNRLQVILMHDRTKLDPLIMNKMREELIDIMLDGIDKSLNFGLACVLSFKSDKEPVLIISSLYSLSEGLLEALKLRATLSLPFECSAKNLKVEQRIKQPGIEFFDFSILRSDNIRAQININETSLGFIEIFTTDICACGPATPGA